MAYFQVPYTVAAVGNIYQATDISHHFSRYIDFETQTVKLSSTNVLENVQERKPSGRVCALAHSQAHLRTSIRYRSKSAT